MTLELTPAAIVAEARSWIGTPYRHQTSVKGIGCDCLGLVRGVWRACLGREPELPQHEEIAPKAPLAPQREFDFDEAGLDQEQTARNQRLQDRLAGTSRQAALDPDDGLGL